MVDHLHHHVRLNWDAKLDIAWWQSFLPSWNGKAFFLEQNTTAASDLSLYTNASGTHGCEAYYKSVVLLQLAATPTAIPHHIHPMAGTFCHSGSRTNMGKSLVTETHLLLL